MLAVLASDVQPGSAARANERRKLERLCRYITMAAPSGAVFVCAERPFLAESGHSTEATHAYLLRYFVYKVSYTRVILSVSQVIHDRPS
jgi:hypothetical protein